MLLSQINTYKNELKERIEFIFYIAFSSKINKSIHKKKRNNGQKHTRKSLGIYLKHNKKLLKSKLVLPKR